MLNRIRNLNFFKSLRKLNSILTDSEQVRFRRIIALTTVGVFLEVFSIVLILPVLGHLTGNPTRMPIPFVKQALDSLQDLPTGTILLIEIIALLGMIFIKNAYLTWLAYKQSSFGYAVQSRISHQLFRNYLFQPFQYHVNRNSSVLINNCVQESNQVNQFMIMPSFTIVSESFLIVGLSTLLLALMPTFTLVNAAILGTAFLLFGRLTGKRILGWGNQRLAAEAKRIQLIQQGLGAIKEVKLRQSEYYFMAQYERFNEKSAASGHSYNALQQVPRLFLEVLLYVGLLTMVLIVVFTGSNVGELVQALGLFAAAVYKLLPSLNKVSTSYQSMKMSAPSIENFASELNLKDEGVRVQRSAITLKFESSLTLKDVWFAYGDESVPLLSNVNLNIQKGECIGFLGESGSGKSTLINIILGLLDPQRGAVLADGIDIRENMAGWTRNIGYVPQAIYLTDDTIRRNIAFGLEDDVINDEAIYGALRQAHLTSFVDSLPEGINTFVGERGVRLSGGQLQRIGIARALYHNPEIIILDEATSSLDYATESSIMDAVEKLYGTKTVIIVAHRLTTLQKCDSLYRIENGLVSLDTTASIKTR
jgi:ATP-binding cassette, subfamily B, bacterial PglK